MIKSKRDLLEYMEADRLSLERKEKRPKRKDLIWKYEIALRKSEYHTNNKGLIHKLLKKYYDEKLFSLGTKCCFTIGKNCIGKGLSLAHIGPVVISGYARIGENCRIHVGVNIGTAAGTQGQAPIIGDNVYIGPGAKLFGSIKIGNNVAIGANAVVNKSFEEDNVTIAGCPAQIISHKGSEGYLIKGSELIEKKNAE